MKHTGGILGNTKLTWEANLEDDIASYKIYRALEDTDGMYAFHYIATVTHDPNSSTQSYIDYDVVTTRMPNTTLKYHYKLKAIDNTNKESVFSDPDWIDALSGPMEKSGKYSEKVSYALYDNYPNPFNPTTTISYSIKKNGLTSLKVYDILGNEVATLVNENETAGNYSVEFNAEQLPSGIYIYRLISGSFTASKKLILLK